MTGATSIPPRTARYVRRPGVGGPELGPRPAATANGAPCPTGRPSTSVGHGAPVSATDRSLRARTTAHPRSPRGPQRRTPGPSSRARQAERPRGRPRPDGRPPRWAEPGRPRSWTGSADPRTPSPGAPRSPGVPVGADEPDGARPERARRGGSRSASHTGEVGPTDQLPPARRRPGVDRAVLVGEPHRSGAGPSAGLGTTRAPGAARPPVEVHEAGREAAERDRPAWPVCAATTPRGRGRSARRPRRGLAVVA